MPEERNRVLIGELVSRASIAAIEPASATDDAIRAAIDACDFDRAATIAFARAKAGNAVPAELVAAILPGLELHTVAIGLVAIASGDRAAALLALLERRAFPVTKDAAELEAIVLYAAWKAGAPRDRMMPEVRRLAVRSLTAEAFALVATVAQSIDDANLATATKHVASFAKEYAKQVAADDRAMAAPIGDVLAALPADVEVSRGGFTVRAAKQVGRNDPCPCGSGLKYKKCCADKPVVAASPIPGLSWDEFLGSGADRMTPEHVAELALRDLARVDLARMNGDALAAAARRFVRTHAWARATSAIDELAGRDAAKGADLRDELVDVLLACGALDRAREHVAKLPEELAALWRLELAVAEGPAPAWTALATAVDASVRGDAKLPDVELALSLLRAAPAVGILAARACIGAGASDKHDVLLDAVEDARDRLNLPPDDPAWKVVDKLDAGKKARAGADSESDTALRTQLGEAAARADQLERALAQTRAALDDARTLPAAELARAPEQPGGLEVKVRELEALIREGNAERRDLRKQLQTATAQDDDVASRHARGDGRARATPEQPPADPDEAVSDPIDPRAREVVIPRFERRAIDALGEVPANIAAEAMRTIGTLAAGDGFAWRGVKQAKDMPTPVLMARVGIHNRLVFRVDDGQLHVMDLVTRETLMTTLKRIRANL